MASRRRGAKGSKEGVLGDFSAFIERTMRRLEVRVYQVLTVETPVRTGLARSGWSPSIGRPDTSGPKGAPSGEGLSAKELERIAKSQARALFSKHKKVSKQIGETYRLRRGPIFISNNINYVTFLDQGSSAQAPRMFVSKSIAIAVAATAKDVSRAQRRS